MPNRQHFVNGDFAYLALEGLRALRADCRMGKTNRIAEQMAGKNPAMTYEALADLTGFSAGYLNRMANSKRNVSLKNLEKIAAALHVSVRDLVQSPASATPEDRVIDALRRAEPRTKKMILAAVDSMLRTASSSGSVAPLHLEGAAEPDSPDTFRTLGSVVGPLFEQESQDGPTHVAKRQGKTAPSPPASAAVRKSAPKPKPQSGARNRT